MPQGHTPLSYTPAFQRDPRRPRRPTQPVASAELTGGCRPLPVALAPGSTRTSSQKRRLHNVPVVPDRRLHNSSLLLQWEPDRRHRAQLQTQMRARAARCPTASLGAVTMRGVFRSLPQQGARAPGNVPCLSKSKTVNHLPCLHLPRVSWHSESLSAWTGSPECPLREGPSPSWIAGRGRPNVVLPLSPPKSPCGSPRCSPTRSPWFHGAPAPCPALQVSGTLSSRALCPREQNSGLHLPGFESPPLGRSSQASSHSAFFEPFLLI